MVKHTAPLSNLITVKFHASMKPCANANRHNNEFAAKATNAIIVNSVAFKLIPNVLINMYRIYIPIKLTSNVVNVTMVIF